MTSVPGSPTGNHLLDAALSYAARGMKVLPLHTYVDGNCTCEDPTCRSPGKHPLTPNGLKDATANEATIRGWWEQAPIANVGVVTGRESGVWMLGPDGPEGIEAITQLEEQHGPLPAGPRSRSGGGGRHYLFSYPPTGKIKTDANVNGLPIDVRGDGGYFVAPPSVHESGGIYAWEISPDGAPPPPAPEWVLKFFSGGGNGTQQTGSGQAGLKLKVQADNFATAPGAKEGCRHKEACRLAGLHVGRGESLAAVEVLARDWAGRCDPPLPTDEVLRVVGDLASKEATGVNILAFQQGQSGDENIDEVNLPGPPPWPVLDPAARHGLAGSIVDTISPQSEADPVAILIQMLAMFGNILGRGPHFMVEADKHYANLFTCLVGNSSKGRKGVSQGRSLALMSPVDAAWAEHAVGNGLSSGEGLIWAVRDPIEQTNPVKDKGRVVGYEKVIADHGVDDKRLLVVESEFAGPLKVMRRESNILSSTVRQAWDTGTLRTLVKNNPARATGAHISIIAHITRVDLLKYLGEADMLNGFANRFLWALVRRSKLLPDGGRHVDLAGLADRLGQAVQHARGVGQMSRTAAASRLWHDAYIELTAERPGLYGAVTARAEAQVLRLSLIYALLDRRDQVEAVHLEAALALWRYCDESAKLIFGNADEAADTDPLAARVLAIIRQAPGGITRRDLYGAFHGHIRAKDLVAALAKLRDKRLIRPETVSTPGRSAECWFPQETSGEQSEQSEQNGAPPAQSSLRSLCSQVVPDNGGREVIAL